MKLGNGRPGGTGKFYRVPLWQGGAVTTMDGADDGTIAVCQDVHNGYVLYPDEGEFIEQFNVDSMPAGTFENGALQVTNTAGQSDGLGAYCLAPAPEDSSKLIGGFNGYVWKRESRNSKWIKMSATAYVMPGAGFGTGVRYAQGKIAIKNANTFMIGPMGDKVLYCLDRTNLIEITVAVGAQREGVNTPHFVAMDRTSNKCCYTVEGEGIHESTTGPAGQFNLLAGSPTHPDNVFYHPTTGDLWALNAGETTGGNVYKKPAGGNFAKMPGGDVQFQTLGVDPLHPQIVIGCDINLQMYKSTDGGLNYDYWGLVRQNAQATATAWVDRAFGAKEANGVHVGLGKFLWARGHVWGPNGFGVFFFDIPATPQDDWNFYEYGPGLTCMESPKVFCTPDGDTHFLAHDRGLFPLKPADKKRATALDYFGDGRPRKLWLAPDGLHVPNSSCWSGDHIPGNGQHIYQCQSFFDNASGSSQNGGRSWTGFGQPSDGNISHGQIIFQDELHGDWFRSNNMRPEHTSDGGRTWVPHPDFPNGGGFGQLMWSNASPACIDAAGTEYVWCYGDSLGQHRGLLKRPLGAASFSLIYSGFLFSNVGSWTPHLKALPGRPGELLWKGDYNTPLIKIVDNMDGTATVTTIAGTSNVSTFGFGIGAPGFDFATYFHGFFNGVPGFYRYDDEFLTPPVAYPGGANPLGTFDQVNWIDGSKVNYGEGYLAMAHSALIGFEYNMEFVAD